MTFSEAYRIFGCDVEAITLVLNHIEPWMIDRLVNRELDRRYQELRESLLSYHRDYNRQNRERLREMRARCSR